MEGPNEHKTIRNEVADPVARLTLSRPHGRNAWTGPMHLEYRWAMTEAGADPEVQPAWVRRRPAPPTSAAPPSARSAARSSEPDREL